MYDLVHAGSHTPCKYPRQIFTVQVLYPVEAGSTT